MKTGEILCANLDLHPQLLEKLKLAQ